MIDLIHYTEPIGKRDHICLKWLLKMPSVECCVSFDKLNYWKADYAQINIALENINWSEVLNDHTVEDNWQNFKNILFPRILNYVPLEKPCKKK